MADEKVKRPAFQFYPGDWRKDVALRACSLAARGLWVDLMCVMHECEPYGHLALNGKPMTPQQVSGQIGVPPMQVSRLLAELLENNVARQNDQGIVYSKRMVDDERVRNARAAGGKAGAEHGAKGAEHGAKGGRPSMNKGGSETPLTGASKPPPFFFIFNFIFSFTNSPFGGARAAAGVEEVPAGLSGDEGVGALGARWLRRWWSAGRSPLPEPHPGRPAD